MDNTIVRLIFVFCLFLIMTGCTNKNYYPLQPVQSSFIPANSTAALHPDLLENPLQKYPLILTPPLISPSRRQALPKATPVKTIRLKPKAAVPAKKPEPVIKHREIKLPQIAETRSDPDWGFLFLLLFSLFLLMLLLGTGFIVFLIYVAENIGIVAFFAALSAIILLYKTGISMAKYADDKKSVTYPVGPTPGFVLFLEAQIPILAFLVTAAGLAFLISLVFGTSFFWTSVIVAAVTFPVWLMVKHIRKKAERRE